MRPVYRAILNLGRNKNDTPTHEDVCEEIYSWVNTTTKGEITAESAFCSIGESVQKGSSSLESVCFQEDKRKMTGFRLERKDNSQNDFYWRTEISLLSSSDIPTTAIVELSNGRKNLKVAPVEFNLSRPKIVPSLLDRFGSPSGMSSNPIICTNEYVLQLANLIKSTDRKLPVVYISRRNDDEEYLLDADKLASQMAGIARVVVAAERGQGFRLEELVGEKMNCYNGAVRIYWPIEEGKMFSPFLSPDTIKKIGGEKAITRIFSDIANFTIEQPNPMPFEEIKHRNIGSKAKIGEAQWKELAESYSIDNQQQNIEIEELRKKVGALQRKINDSESEGTRAGNETYLPIFKNCVDAYRLALKKIPAGKLLCAPRVDRQIGDCDFREPTVIHNALIWLANDYLNARTRESESEKVDLRESCINLTGLTYKAHQSETTMKMYSEEYFVDVNGKRFKLEEHLSKGTSANPRDALRIAFAFDKDSKKVVVGYIGQHQTNRAS